MTSARPTSSPVCLADYHPIFCEKNWEIMIGQKGEKEDRDWTRRSGWAAKGARRKTRAGGGGGGGEDDRDKRQKHKTTTE